MQGYATAKRFGVRLFLVTATALGLAVSGGFAADSGDGVWKSVDGAPGGSPKSYTGLKNDAFKVFSLDAAALRGKLSGAPVEFTAAAKSGPVEILLPVPNGKYQRFAVVESPVMEGGLAARFPEFKTYSARGIDDPGASVRFGVTSHGFHAAVYSPAGAWFVQRYRMADTKLYVSYFRKDFQPVGAPYECLVKETKAAVAALAVPSGSNLRTYRLAMAATGEFTVWSGGTVGDAMAEITEIVNIVNNLYEREVAIRLTLVANNTSVIYTNPATDPYTNPSDTCGALNADNQTACDVQIGSANYDIGHVMHTSGGGCVSGRTCNNANKARGGTGITSGGTGDPWNVATIDFIAHEIGHQFDAAHTWNSDCAAGQWVAGSAFEPGSASTVMGYAGVCGVNDLQPHSDAYFHSGSIDQIVNFTTVGAGNCRPPSPTGNGVPTVSAGADYTIPKGTPFTLTATGSDPDGDTLTYCWEEMDTGAQQALADPDNGESPIFRSWSPTSSPSRTFPRLQNIINNTLPVGEKYPQAFRGCMAFRCTVRDNRPGGGGINTDDVCVTVRDDIGPFRVTSPNTAVTCTCGNALECTWDVAGTDQPEGEGSAIAQTLQVNILLSTDGGLTFPYVLAANTPNDGAESVLVPLVLTSTARIKVEAAGNVFWDMSDANFEITGDANIEVNTTMLDFGVLCTGEKSTRLIEIYNTGCVDLVTSTIAQIGTPNPAFRLLPSDAAPSPSLPVVIAPGSHVNFTLEFTAPATAPSFETATYRVTSTDPDTPTVDVVLAGSSGVPRINTTMENGGVFGNVCVGQSKTLNLVIQSVGDCPVSVNTIAFAGGSGQFSLAPDQTLPAVLSPGDSLNVAVTLAPTVLGAQSDTIVIGSTDAANPTVNVPISGETLPPGLSYVLENGGAFGATCRFHIKSLDLVLNNTGQCPLHVSNIVQTAGPVAFAPSSVVSFPLVVAPGASLEVPMTFAPTDATPYGAQSATFVIESDVPLDEGQDPIEFSLTGSVPAPDIATTLEAGGSFGSLCRGSQKSLLLQIDNQGTCSLHITNILRTAGNAAFSAPTATQYPLVVAPGTAIQIPITFAPTGATPYGAVTATFQVFSDDPDESPVSFSVSGTVPQPGIAIVLENGGNFGAVCRNSQKTIDLQISNPGTCSLTISGIDPDTGDPEFAVATIVSFPLVVAAGGSVEVPLTFSPTGSTSFGAHSALFLINSDAPQGTVEFALSATVPPPDIATTLEAGGNFGDVCRGTQDSLVLQIANQGSCNLNVSNVARTAGDPAFAVSTVVQFPLVVAPGTGMELPITITPTGSTPFGPVSATFTISSDDPDENPVTITVTANVLGSTVATVLENGGNFGDVCRGSQKSIDLQIANTGDCPLTISGIALSAGSPEFVVSSVVSFPLVIAGGTSVEVPLTFAPTAATAFGANTGTFTITSDAVGQSQVQVSVSANVAPPDIVTTLEADGNFGDRCGGDSLVLQIANQGACNLNVSGITRTSGDPAFSISTVTQYPLVIAPATGMELQITFLPTASTPLGVVSATFSIESDDPDENPVTITVTANRPGSGLATVLENGGNFGNVCRGSQKSIDLQITNPAGCPVTISGIALTAGSPEFVVSSVVTFPLVIAGGNFVEVPLTFVPTAATAYGPHTGTFLITGDIGQTGIPVNVSAYVPAPDIATTLENNGDFGDVCRRTRASMTVQVVNQGLCNLQISNIARVAGSPEFRLSSVVSYPIVIAPSSGIELQVDFAPTNATTYGAHTATFEITSQNPGEDPDENPVQFVVMANVAPPVIDVNPCPVDFGSGCTDSSVLGDREVFVCNVGWCELNVTGIDIVNGAGNPSTDFRLVGTPTLPMIINGRSECYRLLVRFTPSSPGNKVSYLRITSDDPVHPVYYCMLTGNVQGAAGLYVPDRIAFPPTVIQNNGPCYGEQALQIGSIGPCNVSVTTLTITGPDAAAFSIDGLTPSMLPATLMPGEQLGDGYLKARFHPQAMSTRRFYTAQINVISVVDPAANPPTTMTTVIPLAGEPVQTGMRLLVTKGGVPVDAVYNIQLKSISTRLTYNLKNLRLSNVVGPPGFEDLLGFQYHAEFGAFSAPTQRLTGNWRLTVKIKDGRKTLTRSINLSLDTCTFNNTMVVNF